MAVDASDTTRGRAAMVKTSLEQSDSSNSCSSSIVGHPAGLLGAPSIEQELLHGDELVGKGEGGGDQREEEEEMDMDMAMTASGAPWPGTLHALYLECLYAPSTPPRSATGSGSGSGSDRSRAHAGPRQRRSAPPFAAVSRLVRALKLGVYTRTARPGNDTDDSDRARNVDVDVGLEAAVEALRALLVPLNKLDVKWHTDVPALVGAWQHEHEQGMQDRKRRQDERIVAATESEQTEGPEKGNHANAGDMEIELGQREAEADAFQTAFASQQAQSTLSRDETAALHGAFTLWLQQQREKDARSNPHEAHNGSLAAGKGSPHGESASTGHKGSGNSDGSIKLGQRDWLMSLEVTEIELQIVLVLHILSVLPTPARHGRKSSHSSASWFSSIRGAASAVHLDGNGNGNGNSTPRKRKMVHPSTLSSTHLSTPRQQRSHETVETDEHVEDAQKRRSRLDRAYKMMAVRLDELTDSLAIHQAVGGIGESLADLMGDLLPPRDGLIGAEGRSAGGAVQELDKYQRFWMDVVEANYADLLPADMLSGCHSKLFTSTSLDLSLHPHAHRRHGPLNPFSAPAGPAHPSTGTGEPSPFHHPTPDLRQLARSIQIAQEERERTRIPASPTLAKLVAAQREREQRERQARKEEARMLQELLEDEPDLANVTRPGPADEDVSGEADGSKDDASWLMPPPESAAVADRFRQLRQPATIKGTLQAGGGASSATQRGLARSKSSGSFANGSRNLFAARQVEFGAKPKPASHNGDAPTRVKKSSGFSSMALVSGSKGANKPVAPVSDVTSGSRSYVAETTEGMDRLSKRKLASPRKSGSSGKDRDRTLVFGTPGRERVKIKSSRRANQSSVFSPFARSASLPSFGASSAAPIVDPDLRAGGGAEGRRGGAGGARQEEHEEDDDDWDEMDLLRSSNHSNGGVLVGETPQKGGHG